MPGRARAGPRRPDRRLLVAAIAGLALSAWPLPSTGGSSGSRDGGGADGRFETLIARADREGWRERPLAQVVGLFGRALEGTPYVAGSLEAPGEEACRVVLDGFDCVTYVETCLDLARVVKLGPPGSRPTFDDLREAVTRTRYRAGRVAGYASRLHYTAEWIADNAARGVLEDITPMLGGVPYPLDLSFMSAHPQAYPALRAQPALVDSIRTIERRVSAVPRTYVPRARVAGIESRLRTGDIVAVTTSQAGLDYSHVGLVFRDRAGRPRFLHASSARGRVVLDDRLAAYLARGPRSDTGISVLRAPRTGRGSVRPGRNSARVRLPRDDRREVRQSSRWSSLISRLASFAAVSRISRP